MNTRNKFLIVLLALPFSCWMVLAQSRGGNWPTFGGDALRSGWDGANTGINKDNAKDMQLLWKLKLESQPRGTRQVMPPVILGRLISYRGFKELGFVATNADLVYSLDVDLGTIFWTKHLEYSTQAPQVMTSTPRCPGGLTAMPTMSVAAPRGNAARGAPAPAAPPTPGQAGQRGSAFIGGPASVYAISSDGRLHRLNTSTGDDMTQPISVIPANARATNLMMVDNVIYTVTSHECGGAPDAVWAIDLTVDPVKVRSFTLNGGSGSGFGGITFGTDGTVYVRAADRVVSLRPRDLQLKDNYAVGEGTTSPLVLSIENRDLVVSDCGNQLCLLTSPVYKTPPISPSARNVSGLASWQEMDGTRWVLASGGSIAAFKVQDQGGKTTLEPSWVSRELQALAPPVVANGVVYALSASPRATLYAFDAKTGKELYSSKNLVSGPAATTGLTIAGGRVYFGGTDGTLYAFGLYMEH